jgi:hypothetical protein
VAAQVIRNEVIAAVHGLACPAAKKTNTSRGRTRAARSVNTVELGGRGIAVEDLADDHVLVVALSRFCEGGERLGVGDRASELQAGVEAVADADHQQ